MIAVGTAGRRDLDWGGQSRSQVVPEPEPWHPDGVRHTTHSDERERKKSTFNSYIQEWIGVLCLAQGHLCSCPEGTLHIYSCHSTLHTDWWSMLD